MISANGSTYWYDTAGRRYYTKIGTATHEFIYDVNGNKIGGSLTNPQQEWALGQIYSGSWHIASYAAGTTLFNHADWLGTVRVVTGTNGAVVNNYSRAGGTDKQPAVGSHDHRPRVPHSLALLLGVRVGFRRCSRRELLG